MQLDQIRANLFLGSEMSTCLLPCDLHTITRWEEKQDLPHGRKPLHLYPYSQAKNTLHTRTKIEKFHCRYVYRCMSLEFSVLEYMLVIYSFHQKTETFTIQICYVNISILCCFQKNTVKINSFNVSSFALGHSLQCSS